MKACENSTTLTHAIQQPEPNWLEKRLLTRLKPMLDREHGTLNLTLPSGYRTRLGHNQPEADVKLLNYRPLLRLYLGGINGWSESYIAGEWESHNLTSLVLWALSYEESLTEIAKASFITQSLHNLYHWQRDNSRKGSQRNISAHYDLGNEFYKLWLDKSMTYSAALYSQTEQTLEQAQINKNARILELLDAKPEEHIVEIGCGWGGFATQAAEESNLKVHGITLSQEQLSWAQARVTDKQLEGQVHCSLTDYRDLQHQYDGVVSIEMFEAVGEAHWDTYFQTLDKVLKPGGKAVLQVITIAENRFDEYRKNADFIQRYIFPGGMLPSVTALKEKVTEHDFELQDMLLFGKDYAQTLREWRGAFIASWEKIKPLGFDERFYRLWNYYLAYCEGGFEQGSIDVGLYVIAKKHDQV
ncbi:MAG: class I SAM-dependent methyltransferase [Neptuniibacter sp.]